LGWWSEQLVPISGKCGEGAKRAISSGARSAL
jgi:hypothetical protein